MPILALFPGVAGALLEDGGDFPIDPAPMLGGAIRGVGGVGGVAPALPASEASETARANCAKRALAVIVEDGFPKRA